MNTIPAIMPEAERKPGREMLGRLLCERGVLTAEQLEEARRFQAQAEQPEPLDQVVITLGFATSEQIVEARASSVGLPFVMLTPELVQPEALSCLPEDYIEEHNLLPMAWVEGWLTVAVERFSDVALMEEIARRVGGHVQVIAAEGANIRQTRESVLPGRCRPASKAPAEAANDLDRILSRIGVDDLVVVEPDQNFDTADLEAVASDSPIVKLVNHIIQSAVEARASDIHVEPDDASFRVRFRVDGELIESIRPTSRLLPAVVSRIKIMAGMDISERRLPQDGGVTVTLGGRSIDLRVATMATKFGEKVVMRIVDHSSNVIDLDALGFNADMLRSFRVLMREANGIVLVTGPTGSGKSTSLYAALSEVVSDRRNISTIEDPIERRLPGTNQFQVHNKAGFTFATALRAMLRQDPDVIMVGEIRDTETARLSVEAALTGHLVFSTLHTNDAVSAVPRLINMGIEPYLVAAALRGVLAQRLVRRVCRHCRRTQPLTEPQRETLAQLCQGRCPLESTFIGEGCPACRGRGYWGRVGVFELLPLNEAMLSAVVRNPGMDEMRRLARRCGVSSLLQDGLTKVADGLISLDGLLEIVSRADELLDHSAADTRAA